MLGTSRVLFLNPSSAPFFADSTGSVIGVNNAGAYDSLCFTACISLTIPAVGANTVPLHIQLQHQLLCLQYLYLGHRSFLSPIIINMVKI